MTPGMPTLLAQLFRDYMSLKEDHVLIYNQKFKLPDDPGIFVTVAFLAEKTFGTNKRYKDNPETAGGRIEVISISKQQTYTVNIFSKDETALERKDEIVAALVSDRCQQMAEKHAFRVAPQPLSFVDLSATEGATRLNRYAITFNVLCWSTSERLIEYFDKFQNPPQTILINP